MIQHIIIVTNNPMALEKFKLNYIVNFVEGDVMKVFQTVRNYVHLNHRLLTHPLVSSIKPNEVPYRTVVITKGRDNCIDLESLDLIENSSAATLKFLKDFGVPNWNESILRDFQLIDFDIINNAIN